MSTCIYKFFAIIKFFVEKMPRFTQSERWQTLVWSTTAKNQRSPAAKIFIFPLFYIKSDSPFGGRTFGATGYINACPLHLALSQDFAPCLRVYFVRAKINSSSRLCRCSTCSLSSVIISPILQTL
jgi:hypothetical protein